MQTDIIVERFMEAERAHGVRYIYFISDGDSSVFMTLIRRVPWGHAIKKLEYADHALVQDNPSNKGRGGLTLKIRRWLVSVARCAIRMRSKETDRTVE